MLEARDARLLAQARAPVASSPLRAQDRRAAVFVPGRGEYGKTCSFVRRASRDDAQRVRERALVLGREADDDVGGEVEVGQIARAGAGTSRRCSGGPSRAARRRRPTAAARGDGARRSASRAARRRARRSTWLISIDERRRRARPGRLAGRADEPRERVARVAVAEAAEVDAREHDLACGPARRAAGSRASTASARAAARAAADERDHAEVAREAAAVLDLHERANALEPRVVVARSRARRRRRRPRPASPRCGGRTTTTLPGRPSSASPPRFAAQPVTYTRPMRARGARRRLARLRQRLVRDAARVDDCDVAVAARSVWPSASSRSRTSCASRCDTLQPRKRTSNVAMRRDSTPRVRAGPPPSRRARGASRRTYGPRLRLVALEVPGRHDGARVDARAGASRRARARCSRPRRRRAGSGSVVASPSRTSIATAFTAGVRACGLDGGRIDVDARAPARSRACAAAIATTPEPQPTSSSDPGSSSASELDAEARRRVRAGAERAAGIDHERHGVRRRRLPRRPDPERPDAHRPVELAPALLPARLDVRRRADPAAPRRRRTPRARARPRDDELLEALREALDPLRPRLLGALERHADGDALQRKRSSACRRSSRPACTSRRSRGARTPRAAAAARR